MPAGSPAALAVRSIAVLAILSVLAGLVVVGIRVASPDEEPDTLLDRYHPSGLGTTWVYETRSPGQPTTRKVVQVVGTAVLADQPGRPLATIVETRGYQGDPSRSLAYQVRRGRSVLVALSRDAGVQNDAVPDLPLLRLPLRRGASWEYEGTAHGLTIASSVTTVTEVRDMRIAGMDLTDCLVFHSDFEIDFGGTAYPVQGDTWTCPGVGDVRTTTTSEVLGLDTTDELIAFSRLDRTAATSEVRAADLEVAGDASEEPGGGPGLGPARANALPEAPDLSTVAWQDLRPGNPSGPPVGTDDTMVLAEEDGAVSAIDLHTGEVRWRARVSGRALGSPTIAGPVVLVVDAAKTVTAFDLQTGRTWWRRSFPDVASSAPLIAHGLALLPFHDRTVRGLRLVDGSTAWETDSSGIVLTPLARAGTLAIASDAGGEVLALDVRTGELAWDGELSLPSEGGPAVAGGLVVLADEESQVTALRASTGALVWTRSLPSFVDVPLAIGPDEVVVHLEGGDLFALDRDDGATRWRVEAGAGAENAPVIAGDEVLVLAEGGHLVRFARTDGRKLDTTAIPVLGDPELVDSQVDLAAFGGFLVAQVDADEPWPNPLVAYRLGEAGGLSGVTVMGVHRVITGGPGAPIDPTGPRGVPIIRDETLVFPGYDGTLWSVPLDPTEPIEPLLVGGEEFVPWVVDAGEHLLVQRGRRLLAVPAGGGDPVWSFEMGEPFPMTAPAVAGGRVFVPIDGGGITALDLATGAVRWEQAVPGIGHSTPVVVGDVVVHAVGGLAGYDVATGERRWRIDGVEAFAPPTAAGGVVYAALYTDSGGLLVAVDAETGVEHWRVPFQGQIFIGPATDGTVVVAIGSDGFVRAFDTTTGQERWSALLRTMATGAPQIVGDVVAVAEEGLRELIDEHDYRVWFLDLSTGAFLGSYEPGGTAGRLPAFGQDDGLLFVYDSGWIVALEVER